MEKNNRLSVREEELLNFLWDYGEAITSNKMAEQLAEKGWNNVTLYKTVQSLSDAGYLEVEGFEKTARTYARKLKPSLRKEDYYTSIMESNGIGEDRLAYVAAALIGSSKKCKEEKIADVISVLERTISNLRKNGME